MPIPKDAHPVEWFRVGGSGRWHVQRPGREPGWGLCGRYEEGHQTSMFERGPRVEREACRECWRQRAWVNDVGRW